MGKPKIRFEGYSEDWEQRKLGDWGNFYYGRSCPKWSVTEDATIPCIRYGELYTKFGAKIDRVYSYTNMPPENLRFSKGTEVLIPRVGEDPMDYNHCTWLSMQDVAIGEMISVFNTDNNPLFTATMFNATLQNEFAMRVEGGSVTNLYFEKLKNIEISFPSIPEQEKIASYFENLDHLITLHQRKCDEIKTLKKYMLQKMFPQNGEKVPEIRFDGFTEDWEQRKLGELGEILTGSTPSTSNSAYYSEDGIPWVTPTDINELTISDTPRKLSEEGAKVGRVVPANTILCTCIASIGKNALLTVKGSFNQQINSLTPSAGNDAYFLLTESELWSNKMKRIAASGTMQIVNKTEFSELDTLVPLTDEQKKIGSYFRNLDHLITLHQRKCNELKEIKKYMLQNMFV
ncbi:restriction endonuclease subunit S [Coprococcus comes]|nr:restriction endonuclease subunit S [Coprococcus comes]